MLFAVYLPDSVGIGTFILGQEVDLEGVCKQEKP